MNKIRPEENAILIWNLELARTAYISGKELSALARWVKGEDNPFSDRLIKLSILSPVDKPAIEETIQLSSEIKSPSNSFYVPESVHIELTEHCPLSCPMCYKNSVVSELPIDFLLGVIRQAGEMKVFQIALGGGEPLMYPNLIDVVRGISRYGMASTITTSGVGLTNGLGANLKQAGLNHIQISLNGSTEAVHSHSRDGFDIGIEALRILQKSGISYGINWVARMDNVDDFPAMVELAKLHKVGNLNILRYKPSPKEDYNNIALSTEKTLLLETFIKNTKGIRIKLDSAFSNLRCKLSDQTSFMSGCGAGRRFIALSACGSYMPCSHVNMKEKSSSLYDVWHNSNHLAMFRSLGDNISTPCADCSYLRSCYGCRAIVLSQEENFNAGDKSCQI